MKPSPLSPDRVGDADTVKELVSAINQLRGAIDGLRAHIAARPNIHDYSGLSQLNAYGYGFQQAHQTIQTSINNPMPYSR